MAVDIFSIKPSVISRDLKGKYVLIYGKEKSGRHFYVPSSADIMASVV